ncbi:MAG: hypothetical protein HW405_439 [Candidatus Berkelbacteria bacterium]|nr:hypothetical protein [Candidatus Berkelbacteria bacterium]
MGLIARIKEYFRFVRIESLLRDTDSFMEWDMLYNDLTYGSYGEMRWIVSHGHRMEGHDEWRYAIASVGGTIRALKLPFFNSFYRFDFKMKEKEKEKNIVESIQHFSQRVDWVNDPVAGDGTTTTEVLIPDELVAIRRHNGIWFVQHMRCQHCRETYSVLRDSNFRLVMQKVKPAAEIFSDPNKALEWAISLDWNKIKSR